MQSIADITNSFGSLNKKRYFWCVGKQ